MTRYGPGHWPHLEDAIPLDIQRRYGWSVSATPLGDALRTLGPDPIAAHVGKLIHARLRAIGVSQHDLASASKS